MPRYRFAVEYFGAPFAGWQLQDGVPTVQGALEKAIATALRVPVRLLGAGRTDAGVHAIGQAVHFDCSETFDPGKLTRSVNALAGPDICIRLMEACDDQFHARYSAISRVYQYRIALRPVALQRALSWHPEFFLDADLLRGELQSALGKRDFLNFSVPRHDGKSTVCHLLRIEVGIEGAFLLIRVEADRFLHKMVRSLVGAAMETARGARAPGFIAAVFAGDFRGERLWAPPEGLCLEKVRYPDYDV